MNSFGFNVLLLLLTIFCSGLCKKEEVTQVDKNHEENENAREEKQLREPLEEEGWRAIDPNLWENSEGWIPRQPPILISGNPPQRQVQRRRRLRKRKRRPAVVNSEESEEYLPQRRRIRPHTLEDINDSWVEADDESYRRPYNRRRTTPVYVAEITEAQTEEIPEENKTKTLPLRVLEKVRNPFTALEEAEAKTRLRNKPLTTTRDKPEETTTVTNLKALLKQSSGTLSLSEILQRRNLSLQDLLKGKQHAISALTEKSIPTTTETSYEYTDSTENPTSTPTTETIKQKLSNIKSFEVMTEPTTERRIFVPSHPKHYTFYNYKPHILNKTDKTTETTTTEATFTTTGSTDATTNLGIKYLNYRSKFVSLKPKLRTSLPITNAKLSTRLNPPIETTTETMPLPSQAFKIDIKDIFGISGTLTKDSVNNSEETKLDEGPIKMTFNIEHLMKTAQVGMTTTDNSLKINLTNILEYNSENEIESKEENNKKLILSDKINPTSAREEIMEILKDYASRQNLSRILQLRNMTVEELVAQRERGSSQLHLADIFHNQTREPEPPSEPFIGHVRSIFPPFLDRKPKAATNKYSSHFTSSNLKPTQLHYTDEKDEGKVANVQPQETMSSTPKYTITSFPTYKIEMEKIMKHSQPPPFQISIWKNLYPNLYTGDTENTDPSGELNNFEPKKVVDIFENDIRRVEEIENSISDAVNGQLNVDLNENNFDTREDYIQLPRGVKSAIIASVAIIGFSVFVFLAVLVIFKWSQKQKKRLSYKGTFASSSKIKSPILEAEPRRTFRAIMRETLGRKKRYSHVYPQSMSDISWENDKKPFQ